MLSEKDQRALNVEKREFQETAAWMENKKFMSPTEIKGILQMHHSQLSSPSPYRDDYCYQTYARRQGITSDNNQLRTYATHKPISEKSTPRPRKSGPDPFEGCLGRIPPATIRAPRLVLEADPGLGGDVGRGEYSGLLAAERCWAYLLDLEDLDLVLAAPHDQVNVDALRVKREQLAAKLFHSLAVHIPAPGEARAALKENDARFVKFILLLKAKKLMVRVLPLLSEQHIVPILLAMLRNLHALVDSASTPADHLLFQHLTNLIKMSGETRILMYLQALLLALTDKESRGVGILDSNRVQSIFLALLVRAHALGMTPYTRDGSGSEAVPKAWRSFYSKFFEMLPLSQLFSRLTLEDSQLWQLLTMLGVISSAPHRAKLLAAVEPIIAPLACNQKDIFLQVLQFSEQ